MTVKVREPDGGAGEGKRSGKCQSRFADTTKKRSCNANIEKKKKTAARSDRNLTRVNLAVSTLRATTSG